MKRIVPKLVPLSLSVALQFIAVNALGAVPGLQQQIPAAEYTALTELYNGTQGGAWVRKDGWMDPTASSWYGVAVSGFNYDPGTGQILSLGTVTELNLSENELSGGIPDSLGDLVNLQGLNLGGNQLSGNIPDSLGNLVALQALYLYGNQLSGPIPGVLGNLVKLQIFYLSGNQLSGNIPDSLGSLVNLRALYLNNNQLSGQIPDVLGNLVNLQDLSIYGNQLSGSIPVALGNLVKLQNLVLSINQLSGSIPDGLGNLVNLQTLALDRNQFSGNLPSGLVHLVNLSSVNLVYNCFDISAGSQPRAIIDQLLQAGKLVLYEPQNADCGPVVLTCPADFSVFAEAGKCSAVVHYPPPAAGGGGNVAIVCLPPSGSVFDVGATIVHCTATAANGSKADCSFTVHVLDREPPKVSCSVATSTLRKSNHVMTKVGFLADAMDNCSGPIAAARIKVKVFSNEDDVSPASGKFSPDAMNLTATGNLLLRAERRGDAHGRVYLIVAKATDSSGNTGFCTSTVTVPHDESAKSVTAVATQAAAAEAYAARHNGVPPPGYFVIGNAAILGQNQGSDGRAGHGSDGRTDEKSH